MESIISSKQYLLVTGEDTPVIVVQKSIYIIAETYTYLLIPMGKNGR